jgi:3-dehydroquinate synthase
MAGGNRIRVIAPGGDYDILIQPGSLAGIQDHLDDFDLWGKVVITTNTTLAPLYGAALLGRLPNAALVTMPDGEQYKTLETVARLYADFVAAGLDRNGVVIALGGGVVGDTVGFAAATYMRGVRLIQIPTSLLAMVDSSVGGKVGVDLPQGKNLVGAFKQPAGVLIDTDVLKTLPPREWRCGMAEVIKHGLLADLELLNRALHVDTNAAELVQRAVQVKVDVVQQDPYEQDIRAHLNLGHTFAHAIEQVSQYAWLHGEAVAVGLVAAARLSHALNLCDAALPDQVEELASAIKPPHLDGLDVASVYAAMATDKKWQNGRSRFVLLRGLGQPVIVEDVPKADVMRVLESLR